MATEIQELPEQGEIVVATVTKVMDHGAYVTLDEYNNIQGFLHISEIAHHRVVSVKNHVKTGDEVQVKVLGIDEDKQKISLSIKATQQAPKPKATDKKDEIEELPDRPQFSRN